MEKIKKLFKLLEVAVNTRSVIKRKENQMARKLRFKGVATVGKNLKTATAAFLKVIIGNNRKMIVSSDRSVYAVNAMPSVKFWDPKKGVSHAGVLAKDFNLTLASDGNPGDTLKAYTVVCSGCKEVILTESKLKHCILCASEIEDSEYEDVELDLPPTEEIEDATNGDFLEDDDDDEEIEDEDGDDLEDSDDDEEIEDEDGDDLEDSDDDDDAEVEEDGDFLEDDDDEEVEEDGDFLEDDDEDDIEVGDELEDDDDSDVENTDEDDLELGDDLEDSDDNDEEVEDEDGDELEDEDCVDDADCEDQIGDEIDEEEEQVDEDDEQGDLFIEDDGSINIDLVDGAELEDTDETDVEYSASIKGEKRWIVNVNGLPVAHLTETASGTNKDIFHTEKFGKVISQVVASEGLKGLKKLGFQSIIIAAPIKSLINTAVQTEISKHETEVSKQLKSLVSDFQTTLGMASVGINRGFFSDAVNPLKVRMWEELSSLGIPQPHRLIDRVFKETAEDFCKILIEKASELYAKPVEVRAELSKAIIGSNFISASEEEDEEEVETVDDNGLEESIANRIEASSIPFGTRSIVEAASTTVKEDAFTSKLKTAFSSL
jgi:hypothetical protein